MQVPGLEGTREDIMLLGDLIDVLEKIKKHIRVHHEFLASNEAGTRMALIDPLLRVLGWDTSDPALVQPEIHLATPAAKNQFPDYALLIPSSKPVAIIEAKKLGVALDEHLDQMLLYTLKDSIPYAVLTNGDRWLLYDMNKQIDNGTFEDKQILSVSIREDEAYHCALQLLLLWRPNLQSRQAVAAKEPFVMKHESKCPIIVKPPSGINWISLSDFQAEKDRRPTSMKFLDGTEKSIQYWYQILTNTVDWLVMQKLLTSATVPISSGSKRFIIHHEPKHPDGNSFRTPREVREFWVETHADSRAITQNAKTLLKHCKQDLSQVYFQMSQ